MLYEVITLAVLARRPGLTERDRLALASFLAGQSADPNRQFQILAELYRSWPAYWHLRFVKDAVATHHPQAALDAVAKADSLPATKPWRGWEYFYRITSYNVCYTKLLRTKTAF